MIQDLHPDLMFIIKATNLISTHNLTLGGTQRERLLTFTRMCLQNSTRNNWMALWLVEIRIWIFEHFYGIYQWIFGTSWYWYHILKGFCYSDTEKSSSENLWENALFLLPLRRCWKLVIFYFIICKLVLFFWDFTI